MPEEQDRLRGAGSGHNLESTYAEGTIFLFQVYANEAIN